MVAVDPTASDQGAAVNSLNLQLADSPARHDGAKLHVVHAYFAPEARGIGHVLRSSPGSGREVNYRACIETAVEERRHNLDALLNEHSLDEIDHELHFLVGAAYLIVPRIAKERQIDVSVIGSSSHTAELGHFIGTTAENIIQKIGCSVLTIKPSGFHSPVGPS